MILRTSCIIILHLFLLSCGKHYVREKQEFQHYSLKNTGESQRVADSAARYKTRVDAETGRVISLSSGELTKDGAECSLGNFVCDAMKYSGEKMFDNMAIDVVLMNRGGLRATLPKGEIKVNHIFELMPFENEMVTVKIKGDNLLGFAELLKEKDHPFLGLKVKRENGNIVSVSVGGSPLDPEKSYSILTSDYLANGGDNFVFLKNGMQENSGIKIRDAIISYCEYLKACNKKIEPYTDGRLEISK